MLLGHLLATIAKLLGPGGARTSAELISTNFGCGDVVGGSSSSPRLHDWEFAMYKRKASLDTHR